jgi:benzoate membrane transport protein
VEAEHVELPLRRLSRFPLQAITGGLTVVELVVAGLSILLAMAQVFAPSESETTTLIVVTHGLAALLSFGLTFAWRVPMLLGYNVSSVFFILSLATSYSYQEVMGGVLTGGALVIVLAVLEVSTRLAVLIPAPIVFGVVAGAVLPFVLGISRDMAAEPAMIGLTVLAYLLARRFGSARVPAILPALGAGVLVALLSGKLSGASESWAWPTVSTPGPVFSWQAMLAIGPVVAILISANSNLASFIYLRSQGYDPPERSINVASGISTMVGGLFGVIPISLAAFLIPLIAGPESGAPQQRSWGPYAASAGMLVIVLFAGMAAQIPDMIPTPLLVSIAGLALLAVLDQMLSGALRGPLRLGPLFAFVVAASGMTLWGFGSAFWALLIGTAVTLLLEQEERATVQQATSVGD